MIFKEMVARDRAAFLNLDEFGEVRRIDGKTITVVVDDNALKERQGGAELSVATSSLLIYAAEEDLPTPKAPGAGMNVDGREYFVDDWSVDMGIVTIALNQHRVI